MSFSINRATLLGNLTKDPEIRYTPNGTAVCSFGMATNNSVKNKQTGEWTDVPTFHNITVWANKAEWCANSLSKGMKVYVEGRIENRSWTDNSGVKKYKSEVVASEVISMSGGSKPKADEFESSGETLETTEAESLDDIDFDNLDLDLDSVSQ